MFLTWGVTLWRLPKYVYWNSLLGINLIKGPFSGFGRQKLDTLQTWEKENITNLSCINLFSKSFIQRNSNLKNRGIKFQSHMSLFFSCLMRQITFKSLLQIKQLTYEAYFVPSCSDEFMFCLGVCCFYVLFSHEMLILMFVDKIKIVL